MESELDSAYRSSIEYAMQPLHLGLTEVALNRLSDLERDLRAQEAKFNSTETFHLTAWTQIQRAAIFEEVCSYEDAEAVLIAVVRDRAHTTSVYRQSPSSCFCIEVSTATMALARIRRSRGDFFGAMKLIAELHMNLGQDLYHGDQTLYLEMQSLWIFCAELLGHDGEKRRWLDPRSAKLLRAALASIDHWRIPSPILGNVFSDHADKYAKSRLDFEAVENEDAKSRYELLCELFDTTTSWSRAFPSASTPTRLLALYSLWKARCEIELELFPELESSMLNAEEEMQILLDRGCASPLTLITVVRALLPLATEIAFHRYSSEDSRSRYFPISYGCIITGESLLAEYLENWPVTQALALAQSLFSNTASSIYEMVGRYPEAISEMKKSVAVIDELLKLDPLNHQAQRLRKSYGNALVSSDASTQELVTKWEWLVAYPD